MSAQINSINDLITRTVHAKTAEAQAEAQRAEAAKAAARQVLATYIEQTLPDVMRLLNFTLDDFKFGDTINGWQATIEWQQEIDGERFPLSLAVTTGSAVIGLESPSRTVHHAWLKPGPQDPVDALGQFLVYVPDQWRAYRKDADNAAQKRMRARIERADDTLQLLAVAAAVDEEDALSDESRRHLRKQIADKIRCFRNQERTARNEHDARLIYAAEIIELAQAYVQEYAWYELACFDWATEWTRELWAPGELYKVRYGPVTADGATDYAIQELVIVENPSTLEWGDWNRAVTEVTSQGQIAKRWIGAFLDAKPLRWDNPSITDRYMYHTFLSAGGYYVNIPPADLVPVDTDAVDAARPTPPDRWQDWLVARYEGDRTLALPSAGQTIWSSAMDAFDVARMTPAEFLAYPKINLRVSQSPPISMSRRTHVTHTETGHHLHALHPAVHHPAHCLRGRRPCRTIPAATHDAQQPQSVQTHGHGHAGRQQPISQMRHATPLQCNVVRSQQSPRQPED